MNNNFQIPKDGYLAFDALTMKELIKKTLNQSKAFTDQAYEGSYITNIINVIAYSYGALMFYLNKTSNESMFTEAQLYENMNRIVKMLGYNPIGFQSSMLSPSINALNYSPGLYAIPRYSYFTKQNISYSLNKEIYFNVTTTGSSNLNSAISKEVLYQGRFYEHPLFTSTGADNEVFIISTADKLIDHFNIHVYVFDNFLKKWKQWEATDNLFLEQPYSNKYEIRINPSQNYEIKFGNNINGAKLNQGDLVAIYYLKTDGSAGEVSTGTMNGAEYVRFTTTRLQQILLDTTSVQSATPAVLPLQLTHNNPSTKAKNGESVEEIRESAPSLFKAQYRLVTKQDFAVFIKNYFSNIIRDVTVLSNMEYIGQYLKYYYDNGVASPDKTSTFLLPQVNFSSTCNFNNIYIIALPLLPTGINTTNSINNLSLGQKQAIYNRLSSKKTITTEPIIVDPVYISVALGLIEQNNIAPKITDIENTSIGIIVDGTRNEADIKQAIQNEFKNMLAPANIKLKNSFNILELSTSISQLPGISKLYTINKKTGALFPGLNFYAFDRTFPNKVTSSNRQLQANAFQALFFENVDTVINNIIILPSGTTALTTLL